MSIARHGLSVHLGAYQMEASVPDDLVPMAGEGDDGAWAAWQGVSCAAANGRSSVVLVSMTVTALRTPQGSSQPGTSQPGTRGDAGAALADLAAQLRARHAGTGARLRRFVTADGQPGVTIRRIATQRVNGRDVTTAQVQAFVAYPAAGALGVVSGVALDPADATRAAQLVTGIAVGLIVTGTAAAALPRASAPAPRRQRR